LESLPTLSYFHSYNGPKPRLPPFRRCRGPQSGSRSSMGRTLDRRLGRVDVCEWAGSVTLHQFEPESNSRSRASEFWPTLPCLCRCNGPDPKLRATSGLVILTRLLLLCPRKAATAQRGSGSSAFTSPTPSSHNGAVRTEPFQTFTQLSFALSDHSISLCFEDHSKLFPSCTNNVWCVAAMLYSN
jgi:hypothetical protein